MRGLILFVIGVVIAQGSWAITALDTLIIDGEQVYLEPSDKKVDDKYIAHLQSDRRKPMPQIDWGADVHAGAPFLSSSLTYNSETNWQTLAQFSQNSPTQKFGFQYGVHAFLPLSQFMPIETVDIQLAAGLDYATSSFDVFHTEVDTSLSTLAFTSINQGIQQIYLVEIQPGVFETDTLNLTLINRSAAVKNLSIPIYARFYINSFTNKVPVRGYLSLGAVHRSYQVIFDDRNSDLLLMQSGGELLHTTATNSTFKYWSPTMSLGAEYRLRSLGYLYAQFNTQGAPVNKSILNDTYTFKQKGVQWVIGLRFNF